MRKYSILIVLMLTHLWVPCVVGAEKVKKTDEWHIFILMGQSNMSGYGDLLPQDSIPADGVFYIPTICEGNLVWKKAAHPLHNRLKTDRFGLGLPFAKEYLKNHPGVKVGLIPVAWGGAGIDSLVKSTPAYNDAIAKAKFAAQYGTIKGVLWHQGESDTVNKELADSYEKKLHSLITDLRSDLGIPELPFIVGNLAEFYGTGREHNAPQRISQINQVRTVLQTLPKKVKNTGYVESTACQSIDHHMVHFDRESYILLGGRYAAEFEKIERDNR